MVVPASQLFSRLEEVDFTTQVPEQKNLEGPVERGGKYSAGDDTRFEVGGCWSMFDFRGKHECCSYSKPVKGAGQWGRCGRT